MNIAILQGRPTRDPEMCRSERTGKVYCKIRLACERPYRGREMPREVDYFNIICFDRVAQSVHNGLCKGAYCTVLGKLQQHEYIDAIGNKREVVNIVAQNVNIHEWMRKRKPLESLANSDDELIPREITQSLFKQIDITDEDVPDELLGDNVDDLF